MQAIRDSGFLAYAVQVEEDIVNQEALRTIQNAENIRTGLWNSVDDALERGYIRERDALLEQENDAKAGRVLKDIHGNWVRVQQYVVRPDEKSVQVVDVNLRGLAASDLSGLTVMDWQTSFTDTIPSGEGILAMPWGDYLHTEHRRDTTAKIDNNGDYLLEWMSVEFRHGSDSLKESRSFGNWDGNHQLVKDETLTVNGGAYSFEKDLGHNSTYKIDGRSSEGSRKFKYHIKDADGNVQQIESHMFVVGDMGEGGDAVSGKIEDIWSALAVNMDKNGGSHGGPQIGDHNLEIRFTNDSSSSLLAGPLDIVYIPLPQMTWRTEQ
jgi:hypothetical protein